jgi:signal transduction histidine kinase
MVAHEVRNALVPVKVAADALFEKARSADTSEAVVRAKKRIDDGLKRVFDFVEELLRTAAIAERTPVAFDPVEAIRDAVAAGQADAGPATRIDSRLSAGLPWLTGSRDRFTLAVTNLVRNAVQVLNGRGGEVKVEAEMVADAIEVRVADDGPGIPPEMRALLFQPGFSSKSSGTGFGLALAREVVEDELGGTIEYRDAHPHGAVFVVRLPTAGKGRSP